MTPVEKLLASVKGPRHPDHCWVTSYAPNSRGYPTIRVNGKTTKAHRVMCEAFNGPIPKGWDCCHRCDNRLCINPAHLFAGTRDDNVQDMVRKGRNTRDDRHPEAKLTQSQVEAIRADRITTDAELARLYKVSPSTIWRCRAGEHYRFAAHEKRVGGRR